MTLLDFPPLVTTRLVRYKLVLAPVDAELPEGWQLAVHEDLGRAVPPWKDPLAAQEDQDVVSPALAGARTSRAASALLEAARAFAERVRPNIASQFAHVLTGYNAPGDKAEQKLAETLLGVAMQFGGRGGSESR